MTRASDRIPPPSELPAWLTRRAFWLRVIDVATWANAVVVAVVTGLILGLGERWWLSAALEYLPRLPWAIPSVLLFAVCIVVRRRLAVVPAATGIVAFVVLMGLCLPIAADRPRGTSMRVVSCNIQNGDPRFASVVIELQRADPDVMLFQECQTPRERVLKKWPDFHNAHFDGFDVMSRWPVEQIDVVESDGVHGHCAAVFRVHHPDRPFVLVNVHLSTARHGLANLRKRHLGIREATRRVSEWQALRARECDDLAAAVHSYAGEPVVLAGDFNQPWSGQFLQDNFVGWRNAFDAAGFGYGYTAPTDSGRLWPSNSPWLRIDHVAVNADFGITHAEIGRSAGSDHRLIAADLTW